MKRIFIRWVENFYEMLGLKCTNIKQQDINYSMTIYILSLRYTVQSSLLSALAFVQWIINKIRNKIYAKRGCSVFDLNTKRIFIIMNERKYGNSTKKHSRKNFWQKKNIKNINLNIKFQLNCFFKLSWNISLKEIFSFQNLNISFSKILLQKKLPHTSLVLLFYLHNKEEVICKNEKCVL